MHRHGIEQLYVIRRQGRRQTRNIRRQRILVGHGARHPLRQRHARQQHGQVGQRARVRQAAQRQFVGHRHHARAVSRRHGVEQAHQVPLIDRAQHAAHGLFRQIARAIGNRLVRQRQRIAHRPARRLADQPQRAGFKRHLLSLQHMIQMTDDRFRRHLLQIELQATAQHGHGNLLRIRGGQNEFDVRRRLFQRLEHGVERVPGQHVDFVDHVDLEAARGRRIHRLFQQLGHFVNAAVGRRVELKVIDESPRIDLGAGPADTTRRWGDARLAIERLGQDPRQRRLAHTPRPGEQPGVMQPLRGERVRKRTYYVFLSDQRFKRSEGE